MRKFSASPAADAFDDDEDMQFAKVPAARKRPPIVGGFEEEPDPRPATKSAAARKPGAAGTRKYRHLPQAATIFGAAVGALMVAIAVNALAFQKERHPAPLFDQASHAADAASLPAGRPQAAALQPPRPQVAQLPEPVILPAVASAAPRQPERPHDATASLDKRPKDPVGDLLKAGRTPEPAIREPSAAVAAIQRTLAKLGYGVVVDGLIGPATQGAIARFEKDHRLPVKGQLTAKLFREITSAQAQLPH